MGVGVALLKKGSWPTVWEGEAWEEAAARRLSGLPQTLENVQNMLPLKADGTAIAPVCPNSIFHKRTKASVIDIRDDGVLPLPPVHRSSNTTSMLAQASHRSFVLAHRVHMLAVNTCQVLPGHSVSYLILVPFRAYPLSIT